MKMTVTTSATALDLLPHGDLEPMWIWSQGNDGAAPTTINNFNAPVQIGRFYYSVDQEALPSSSSSSRKAWKTVTKFAVALPVITLICAMLSIPYRHLDASYKQRMDAVKEAVPLLVTPIADTEEADEHLRDLFTLGQNPINALNAVAAASTILKKAATKAAANAPAELSRHASALVKAEDDFVQGAWAWLHDHDLGHVNDLLDGVLAAEHSFISEAHRLQDQSIFGYAFSRL
jgi:hypothetical protein